MKYAGMSTIVVVLLLLAIFVFGSGNGEAVADSGDSMMKPEESATETVIEGAETAVLAGGCFWGVEAVFERLEGVYDVASGYSGGLAETASYYRVASGRTDHAESVRIVYDPAVIAYTTILEVFFSVAHDPTQLNFQGPDVGPQYRSAIFYSDETQMADAEEYIRELESSGMYRQPIVTEVAPLEAFYDAEDAHQDFMELNPNHGYIVYWDKPKIDKLEKEYPHLLSDE
jgi:peptide-methionine (S)-S-oxide reductase